MQEREKTREELQSDLDALQMAYDELVVKEELYRLLTEQAHTLKELNATKDKFFSIIAHDLRSPFNGILALSDLLRNEVHGLDAESIKEYADYIYTSARQAFGLLENLLNWANTQQGSMPFSPSKLCVNELIIREIAHLKSVADQKRISLSNITNDMITIEADEKMLGTIVRNLISNAIKFTHQGGSITIRANQKTDHIDIVVSDTGVGMSEEAIDHLFKMEKGNSTIGTQNEKGTGLGLIICKEFVDLHGGSIMVESAIGRGSQFHVILPLKSSRAN